VKKFKECIDLKINTKHIESNIKTIEGNKNENSVLYGAFSSIDINRYNANLMSFFYYFVGIVILILLFRNIENVQLVYDTENIAKNIVNSSAETAITLLFSLGAAILLTFDILVLRNVEVLKNKIKKLKEQDDFSSQSVFTVLFVIIGISSFYPVTVAFFVMIALGYSFLGLCIFVPVKLYHVFYKKFLYRENSTNSLYVETNKLQETKERIEELEAEIIDSSEHINELILSKKEGRLNKDEQVYYDYIIKKHYNKNVLSKDIEDIILNLNEEQENDLKNY